MPDIIMMFTSDELEYIYQVLDNDREKIDSFLNNPTLPADIRNPSVDIRKKVNYMMKKIKIELKKHGIDPSDY